MGDAPSLELPGLGCLGAEVAPRLPLILDASSDTDAAGFREAVEGVREAIRRGDVYVLNLTRRLRGRARADGAATFRALVAETPARMAAAWEVGGRWIASASPERFVRVRGHEVCIEPGQGHAAEKHRSCCR